MTTQKQEQHPQGHPTECLKLVADFENALDRLDVASGAAAHMKDFQRMLDSIAGGKAPECRNMREQAAEMAFDAERQTRVMGRLGLDAMNELRDSGMLEQALTRAAKEVSRTHGKEVLPAAIKRAKKALAEQAPGMDTTFLDEAARLLERHEVSVRSERQGLRVELAMGDGTKMSYRIDPVSRPGSVGRVGSRELFAVDQTTLKAPVATFRPEDCHHRNQVVAQAHEAMAIDHYGLFVGAQKNASELIYAYARQVSEIGAGYLSGRDPVTAVLVALAIVAAALVIAGATIEIGCAAAAWSGDVCDYGFWMVLGGIVLGGIACVTAGACTAVAGVLAGIAA
jgi:hypothetical protein